MSSTSKNMLGIGRALLQASPHSSQSYNGFLGGVSFASVQVRTIKEATGDMLGGVGDMGKSATSGTSETGRSTMESSGMMGEKGMHTADRTADTGAETTKHISDRMIHEAEDKLDEECSHQPTDSSVEDLRSREKGYD